MNPFSAVRGLCDLLPGWLWAALVAAFALHSCVQSSKLEASALAVSQQAGKTKDAEGKLAARIAAEAAAVATGVQKALDQERAAVKNQTEKVNALRNENAAARIEHAAANNRVYGAIALATPGSGCTNLPEAATDPGRAANSPQAQFDAAGRNLADGLLQLLATGDEAIRERGVCIAVLPAQ